MSFGLAEGRPPKRRNKISRILSKEARCFGVFWFGRGPPLESMSTVAKSVEVNLKQFLRRQSLRRIGLQFFFGVASRPNQNKTTEKTEAIFFLKTWLKKGA